MARGNSRFLSGILIKNAIKFVSKGEVFVRVSLENESQATGPKPSKPCILLVEDNAVNQKVILVMLSKEGYDVITAANGVQALELFETHSFDLVLMDIQMPIMGGIDATKKIRALEQERGGHTPIVALTANAMKGDRETYLAAGMDEYLSKPIQKDQLIEMINGMCKPLH